MEVILVLIGVAGCIFGIYHWHIIGLVTAFVVGLWAAPTLLEIGGLGFYLFVAAACLGEIVAIEWESGWAATLTLVLSLLVLNFFSKLGIFAYVYHHVWWSLGYVAGYAIMGMIWSGVKWWFYTKKERETYNRLRHQFFTNKSVPYTETMPVEWKRDWAEFLSSHRYEFKAAGRQIENYRPDPYAHKPTILMWIGHWPFSMLWTLINDPVKRFLNWAFERLNRTYHKISEMSFAGTEKDFLTDAEKEQLRLKGTVR